MYFIASLPGEILDLVFTFLEPYDLKNLRLTGRLLHDHIGHSYIQRIVVTSNREHLKFIETFLDSESIARCIKRLTFDCCELLPIPYLARIVYPKDSIGLILDNCDRIGDLYSGLASRFLSVDSASNDLIDLLWALTAILRKLPSLRHVIVAERTHYATTLPASRYLVNELKAIHPILAPHVNHALTKRLLWSDAGRTRILTRAVILAVWRAEVPKCSIELRTMYARYGDGGGPTTRGLCDVVEYAHVSWTSALKKKLRHVPRKDKKSPGRPYAELIDGSPVIWKRAEDLISSEEDCAPLGHWPVCVETVV